MFPDQRPPMVPQDVSDLNLTCAECGVKIEQLPFKPTLKEDGTYGKLYCRDCNKKRKQNSSFGGGFSRGGGNRRPNRY